MCASQAWWGWVRSEQWRQEVSWLKWNLSAHKAMDFVSGSKQPIQLLEELAQYQSQASSTTGGRAEEVAREIKHTFSHWILRFPSQCVLTAEAVLWERSVCKALEKQDLEDLKNQRGILISRMEQYVQVVQESITTVECQTRLRLHCLLGNLVNQSLYHRDILDSECCCVCPVRNLTQEYSLKSHPRFMDFFAHCQWCHSVIVVGGKPGSPIWFMWWNLFKSETDDSLLIQSLQYFWEVGIQGCPSLAF